jgi:hypothetical protein
MLRAGWSSWRACLVWGIATAIVSQCFGFFMPGALAHPIPGASIANPVLAFEFARTAGHLDAIFGLPGDPLRDGRIAGMFYGNVFDYLFMVVYGSFVLAFFGASSNATGNPRWWLAGWLGPLAAVADAIENALLLSINSDMASPDAELANLPVFVWTKFIALSLACGLAAWALVRQRAWLPAVLIAPPALAIWSGVTAPFARGEVAVFTIFVAWVTMLVYAAWRAWREKREGRLA